MLKSSARKSNGARLGSKDGRALHLFLDALDPGVYSVRSRQLSGIEYGAVFDTSEKYRYLLWRQWDRSLPAVTFLMLNPSTADEHANDPTIARCMNFAQRWGFGGMSVVNLFAIRLTDSTLLCRQKRPIGSANDEFLSHFVRDTLVVAAWGNIGAVGGRAHEVMKILESCDNVKCFGLTKQGHPRHPLYVRSQCELVGIT